MILKFRFLLLFIIITHKNNKVIVVGKEVHGRCNNKRKRHKESRECSCSLVARHVELLDLDSMLKLHPFEAGLIGVLVVCHTGMNGTIVL
jgi:hypothetical protein